MSFESTTVTHDSNEFVVCGYAVTLEVIKAALEKRPSEAKAHIEKHGTRVDFNKHIPCKGVMTYLNAMPEQLGIVTCGKILEAWIDWGIMITAKVESSKEYPGCYTVTTTAPLLRACINRLNKGL